MRVRTLAFVLLAVGAVAFCALEVQAQDPDVHTLFETKCGACHGHSGPFARESLLLSEDRIVGRKSGQDVAAFLTQHHGRPSAEEIERLVASFRMQLQSGGLYEEHCRICHKPAKDLARLTLIVTGDRLVGRYSGVDIGAFLTRHGRLDEAEARLVTEMLRWQLTGG